MDAPLTRYFPPDADGSHLRSITRAVRRGDALANVTYSPTRIKYPYARAALMEAYRSALHERGDSVAAWGAVVGDPERRTHYVSARGRGGLVRLDWDEAAGLIAASIRHTLDHGGPGAVGGYSPDPASSLVSHGIGARFFALIGAPVWSPVDPATELRLPSGWAALASAADWAHPRPPTPSDIGSPGQKILTIWRADPLTEESTMDAADLLVCLDHRMTRTAWMSDLILPAATRYEKHDMCCSDTAPYVHASAPTVSSPWQARSDFGAFTAFARALAGSYHAKLTSVGPLTARLGSGISQADTEIARLRQVNGTAGPGPAEGRPVMDTEKKMAEAILTLSGTTTASLEPQRFTAGART